MIKKIGMLWSDGIDLEEKEGWFSGCEWNALFKVDFETNEFRYIHKFKDYGIENNRKNSLCKKYGDKIFCFPVYGDKIWIYHISQKDFSAIEMPRKRINGNLLFSQVFLYKNRIYAVSRGMCAVLRIDVDKEIICDVIDIPKDRGALSGNWIQCENKVLGVYRDRPTVIEIDVDLKTIRYYDVPGIKGGFSTISFIQDDIFVLSGYQKEIYIWNVEINKADILTEFPKDFGRYVICDENDRLMIDYEIKENKEALFLEGIDMGKYIWFIPFRTNKIVYLDKETYKIGTLEIENEEESFESWKRPINCKYQRQYLYENRIIGIYSFKNREILEIDTTTLCVNRRNFFLQQDSIDELKEMICEESTYFRDESEYQRKIFMRFGKNNFGIPDTVSNIGKTIYQSVIK